MTRLGSVKLYSDKSKSPAVVVEFFRKNDHYVAITNGGFYCECETRDQVSHEIIDLMNHYNLFLVPVIFTLKG